MSDDRSTQERTEQPTPKRLQDARRKGQVARSRELNTMAVMITAAATLWLCGDWMMGRLEGLIIGGFTRADVVQLAPSEAISALGSAAFGAMVMMAPLLVTLLVAAFAGPAMMGGLVFSGEALTPKLERLSPLSGIKRIFSVQGLAELLKTLLKFTLLSGISLLLLWSLASDLLALGHGTARLGMAGAADLVRLAFLVMAAGLVLIAALDAPFQVWSHKKQLRMTRQEVKDEMKETEGNPELRARIRRLQQEMSGRRMMREVPDADVVITNPTHFAVALKYSDRPNLAPRVVAKGQDLVAQRIRELAAENHVTIVSVPLLARAIYFNTDIGQEIPAGLYLAVARILAYVFQLEASRKASRPQPVFPEELPIPDDLMQRTGRER